MFGRAIVEEHMDALVVKELPEIHDRRQVALEERREPLGVALVGKPFVRVSRICGISRGLGEQIGQSLLARPRPPLVDVDAGWHLVNPVDMTAHLLENVADVRGADDDARRPAEDVSTPALERWSTTHRVLELRAVGLYRIARA